MKNEGKTPPDAIMKATYSKMLGQKTMWCHQMCDDGFAVTMAEQQGKSFSSEDEIWEFVKKSGCKEGRCLGRFTGSMMSNIVTRTGPLVENDHDNTNNENTCLFNKSGFESPTPKWALKEPEFKAFKK